MQTNVDNIQQHAPQFKARPPTVLYKKPFEPKPEAKPLTEITEFNLNTDKRAKERELFEEDLRKKQERLEQLRKEVTVCVSIETRKICIFFVTGGREIVGRRTEGDCFFQETSRT